MTKNAFLLCVACLLCLPAFAHNDSVSALVPKETFAATDNYRINPYRLRWSVDAPIIIPCAAWSLYALPKNYDKPNIDSATLAGLTKDKIPSFDRWAVRYSDKADAQS